MPHRLPEAWKTFTVLAATGAASLPDLGGAEQWWEFVARQGAAFLVLGAVLYFYRRDYRSLVAHWQLENTERSQLLEAAVKAMTEMAAAQREHTRVLHTTKDVMQSLVGEIQLMEARREGAEGRHR